jgi:hypothetical protein
MAQELNNLEIQRVEDQRASERSKRDTGTQKIKGDSALATHTAERFEFAPAQFGDVTGLPALTSRRFTGADLSAGADIHTFDFTRMHSASVVSARSWGCPSIDSLSGDLNAHGVASFDRFNAIPTDLNPLDRIGDADSFIEDFNLWMDEEQIRRTDDKDSPRTRNQVALNRAHSEGLYNQCENYDRRNSSREPRAARTIENHITHTAIFSQQSGLEGSEK